MIHKIISFKQLQFKKQDNFKIAQDYKLPVQNDSDVFVRIEPDYEKNHYETVIDNRNYHNLARNQFAFDEKTKTIKNGGMDVWSKNQRGKGLGVVLHLNNIMELLENDLDKIELYSMGKAVLFHGKCKFEPVFTNKDDIENALYVISLKDYEKFPQIKESVEKATEYLNEIVYTGGFYCLSPKNLKKASDIVTEYIEKVNTKKLSQEEREEYGFPSGFDMVLTREKILENKDFFNTLFKKYKVDYQIKDPQ